MQFSTADLCAPNPSTRQASNRASTDSDSHPPPLPAQIHNSNINNNSIINNNSEPAIDIIITTIIINILIITKVDVVWEVLQGRILLLLE